MKVILLNGSAHLKGCTFRALQEVEKSLNDEGIETEIIFIGNSDNRGCISCNSCQKNGKCVFSDKVNEVAEKFRDADGIVIGTPVYYAGSNGGVLAFLDRLFYSSSFDKTMKVGACVISSRRAGSTSAWDEINKYFGIASMPIATSNYWNEVHGSSPSDVENDLEGLQTMRVLGRNMAFLIKGIHLAKESIGLPVKEDKIYTNFSK